MGLGMTLAAITAIEPSMPEPVRPRLSGLGVCRRQVLRAAHEQEAQGCVDRIISNLVDLWMSLPPVVLSLTLMVGFGTGVGNVILSIVLVDWTRFCRVVRSEVIVVARKDFVSAARLLGFGDIRIILREILPSVAPLIITLFTLQVGIGIIVEAILSFVGLSVPANVPAWGKMIAGARNYMYQAPWGIIMPILAMFVTVLGFNLLGEGLRVSLDPRLRRRTF